VSRLASNATTFDGEAVTVRHDLLHSHFQSPTSRERKADFGCTTPVIASLNNVMKTRVVAAAYDLNHF
jgi:hypothetical protein